jgi:hypothetical protein
LLADKFLKAVIKSFKKPDPILTTRPTLQVRADAIRRLENKRNRLVTSIYYDYDGINSEYNRGEWWPVRNDQAINRAYRSIRLNEEAIDELRDLILKLRMNSLKEEDLDKLNFYLRTRLKIRISLLNL